VNSGSARYGSNKHRVFSDTSLILRLKRFFKKVGSANCFLHETQSLGFSKSIETAAKLFKTATGGRARDLISAIPFLSIAFRISVIGVQISMSLSYSGLICSITLAGDFDFILFKVYF
jgi:hypothetical protein